MRRGLLPIALALCACTPPSPPKPDARPDAVAEAAADVTSAPDAEPTMDARADVAELPDVASTPDATHFDVTPDENFADTWWTSDARTDGGAPDINVRHDTMELRVLMLRTCGAGMMSGCDRVQAQAFEASCSLRGTRFSLSFLPTARVGMVFDEQIAVTIEPPSTTIAVVTGTGQVAQGTEASLSPGLEWIDGMGQRRQNFHVRARMLPNAMLNVHGIAGIYGQTTLLEFADFYALGCPKGP